MDQIAAISLVGICYWSCIAPNKTIIELPSRLIFHPCFYITETLHYDYSQFWLMCDQEVVSNESWGNRTRHENLLETLSLQRLLVNRRINLTPHFRRPCLDYSQLWLMWYRVASCVSSIWRAQWQQDEEISDLNQKIQLSNYNHSQHISLRSPVMEIFLNISTLFFTWRSECSLDYFMSINIIIYSHECALFNYLGLLLPKTHLDAHEKGDERPSLSTSSVHSSVRKYQINITRWIEYQMFYSHSKLSNGSIEGSAYFLPQTSKSNSILQIKFSRIVGIVIKLIHHN